MNLAHRVYSASSKIPPENKSYGFVTPWTVALQTHLSMEFSRQGCCSGLPFPSKGDLPDPGMELLALQPDSLPSEPAEKTCFICESESHSVVSDSVTPRTIKTMEFSRPEYWNG